MRERPLITITNMGAPGGNVTIGKPSGPSFGSEGGDEDAGSPTSSVDDGTVTDSFSFGPFLATTIEYVGRSLVSRRVVSLNLSTSRFRSITRNCSFVVPGGI